MDSITEKKSARGATEIVRFLKERGYKHVFGLPGSSMVSALHELQNSSITHVPTIHESVTVAAADGYSRVAGSGVAMVYMVPGVANAIGNLYDAWRDESPVMLIASQQASHYRTREGTVGEGDTVAMVRPFTRLAQEVASGMPVRGWLEAARRSSQGLPGGPAFLSINEDVFEDEAPVEPIRLSVQAKGGAPDIALAVQALRTAKRPLIIVGGQLHRYGGTSYVEQLAERFEIPVVYEFGFNDRLGIAPGHSHCFGNIMTKGVIFEQDSDVVLMIGARYMMEGHPRPKPWFENASFIGQVNADQAKLEETRTADWVAACDPGSFAKALLEAMIAQPPEATLIKARSQRLQKAREPRSIPLDDPAVKAMLPYVRAVSYLHDAMERGWVVEEAVMASWMLVEALKSKDSHRFVASTGGSLGWATGASVGVALASGEPVTCVLGDGALRFGSQGLWTIGASKLPITLVIMDNGGYGSTRHFEREYIRKLGDKATMKPGYLNMDFRSLGQDVGSIIRGYGIPCQSLSPNDDPRAAILDAWEKSSSGPNAVVIPLGFEG